MRSFDQVNSITDRQTPSVRWDVSSTRFSTDWRVTATLLVTDLIDELEYNSTFGPVAHPVAHKPAAPVFPSFFNLLEAEAKPEDAVSFLE